MDAIEQRTIKQRIGDLHSLSQELVYTSIMKEPLKTAELLNRRALLLDELGEFIRAGYDRDAAQFIREHHDESYFYLCCKLTARINLKAIGRRHGIGNFKLT